VEFVRVPDPQLGYLAWGWLTMGQIQSLPLIVIGLVLLWMSRKAPTMRLYNVSMPTQE
jgi:phosphatidylglycerol:prolipoprotein diacylglycerol transferase